MTVEMDPTGTKERTNECSYYLEDIYLKIIFMPDSSPDVVA